MKKKHPFAIRALNFTGRALSQLGLKLPTLNIDEIHKKAKQRTGLTDFGDNDYLAGLDKLIKSTESEAKLSQIGKIAAKAALIDNLANRMLMVDFIKRNPAVKEEIISQPMFIMGLPRTGTTILHAIIAEANEHRAPRLWEMQRPFPPPAKNAADNEARILELEKNAAVLDILAPEMKLKHESNPRLVEECLPWMATSFFQEQFSTVYRLPSYRQWYLNADPKPAYQWHKLYLQYMQFIAKKNGQTPQRWILKSPAHLPFIEAILSTYPDAVMVQTHRDPLKVLASACSLLSTLRGAFSDAIDPVQIGEEESQFYSTILNRGMAARQAVEIEGQFYDFQFDDVIHRPVDGIADLFQHFNLNLTDESRGKMQSFINSRPRTMHGKHVYTMEQFGLTEEKHGPLFNDYRKKFVQSTL
ncbi:MAG: sulfotransferase [Pseudomonadota bacterium]|nr:sulfotransferase [Pseudomonadota bacterium]